MQEFPYAEPDGGNIAIIFDPNYPAWFRPSGGGYSSMFDIPGMGLSDDTLTQQLTYTENQGGLTSVTVFNDGWRRAALAVCQPNRSGRDANKLHQPVWGFDPGVAAKLHGQRNNDL